jgi:hypothetical protein
MTTSTVHWKERSNRNEFIEKVIGVGNPIRHFFWDKGHPNGPEIHTITDTGIIIIRNYRTNKLVTQLIARPGQVARYYNSIHETPPEYLMKIAEEHYLSGYNLK